MHAKTSSVLIHRSRAYDLAFGWLIRRTDAELLARADVTPGDQLLDVGTGPGYLALAASTLVAPGGVAIGIDASPEMIDRARILAARRRSGAEYAVATAESLPFDDDTFDVVVSRLVFHHLADEVKKQALSETGRVLRPGGRLLIADLASPVAKRTHRVAAYMLGDRPDTGTTLEQLIRGAGFVQITSARLAHGLLVAVAARSPERRTRG